MKFDCLQRPARGRQPPGLGPIRSPSDHARDAPGRVAWGCGGPFRGPPRQTLPSPAASAPVLRLPTNLEATKSLELRVAGLTAGRSPPFTLLAVPRSDRSLTPRLGDRLRLVLLAFTFFFAFFLAAMAPPRGRV